MAFRVTRRSTGSWGIRTWVLLPIVLLALLQLVTMSFVVAFINRAQAAAGGLHAGGSALDHLTERVRERQGSTELLARVLVEESDLAGLLESGDQVGLARLHARLEAQVSPASVVIYNAAGRPLAPATLGTESARTRALVDSALRGEARSNAVIERDGLLVLAATPVKVSRGIVGAIFICSPVGAPLRRAVADEGGVQLLVLQSGRVVDSTVLDPALAGRLLEAGAVGGPEAIVREARALGFEVVTRNLPPDGTLLALAPRPGGPLGLEPVNFAVLALTALLSLLLLVVGLQLSREIAAPLQSMAEGIRNVMRGNYRPQVEPSQVREVNDLRGAIVELASQACLDSLTRLPNRAMFRDCMAQALARAARRQTQIAVLFLDLDDFKIINDSLGHEAGDELLIGVAQRLQRCLRSGDVPARLGGDEFTILLEDITSLSDATQIADRVAEQLRHPFRAADHEIFVNTSIGIALSTPAHLSPDDLLRDADVALYEAKRHGKASYAVFEPSMNAHVWERLNLESDLRRAIERREFRLRYQPVIDLASGKVTELEALVRWEHPRRGELSPADFIPLAEETGLILPIGQWVLTEACKQASLWKSDQAGGLVPTISVNLSSRHFQQPRLVQRISDTLFETGLDPQRLKLEITESVMVKDAEIALTTLTALKRMGIQVAIDDFGTGFSSLSYLKRFPIDALKIDRTFIAGLGVDSQSTAIVAAVIAFAKTLKLAVIGEGIESAEQMSRLRSLGCDLGQGYHFTKPLPGDLVASLLTGTHAPTEAVEEAGRVIDEARVISTSRAPPPPKPRLDTAFKTHQRDSLGKIGRHPILDALANSRRERPAQPDGGSGAAWLAQA